MLPLSVVLLFDVALMTCFQDVQELFEPVPYTAREASYHVRTERELGGGGSERDGDKTRK